MALEPGVKPVRECILACEDLLRWRGTEHPGVLSDLAYLRSMLGQFDETRELVARARRLLAERIRALRPLGQVLRRGAEIEILADDLESAERALREALEVNAGMEERDPVSQITAILSRILSMQGNTREAARLAGISKDHAPSESVAAQALWRASLARVLASRGELREAEALARKAVELAPAEMLNLRAGPWRRSRRGPGGNRPTGPREIPPPRGRRPLRAQGQRRRQAPHSRVVVLKEH